MNNYFLALDTSSSASSLALWHQGEVVESTQHLPRAQAQALLPQLNELLATAGIGLSQLTAIAYGKGPGSFTGLRIAASSAQGLGLALDVPLIGISTLETLAWQAINKFNAQQVLTLIDARMQEIYWCTWQAEGKLPKALQEETLSAPQAIVLPANLAANLTPPWLAIGSGCAYKDEFSAELTARFSSLEAEVEPSAAAMAHLAVKAWQAGKAQAAETAEVTYLRNQVTN